MPNRTVCCVIRLVLIVAIVSTVSFAQEPTLIVQTGNAGLVRSISFSSDGSLLATAGASITLWEVATGRQLRTFESLIPDAFYTSVSISPDGQFLAAGDHNGFVRLFDLHSGEEVQIFSRCGSYSSVVFSPNGKLLAIGGWFRGIVLWKLQDPKERARFVSCGGLKPLWSYSDVVSSVAFSRDGKLIAGAGNKVEGNDTRVIVWDVESGKEIHNFRSDSKVNSVAFSPNAKTIATGNDDATIRRIDLESEKELSPLRAHASVHSVTFSPNGKLLASADTDTSMLWSLENGKTLKEFKSFSTAGTVIFSFDGTMLAFVELGTVKLWSVEGNSKLPSLGGQASRVASIKFSSDGDTLASASLEGINLWDMATGKHVRRLVDRGIGTSSIEFSPDGKKLAAGGGFGPIVLWNVKTGTRLHTLLGHTAGVKSISFSPSGKLLASGGDDNTIRLWNVENGEELKPISRSSLVDLVRFSSDGRTLATVSRRLTATTVTLWDVDSRTRGLETTDATVIQSLDERFGCLSSCLEIEAMSDKLMAEVEEGCKIVISKRGITDGTKTTTKESLVTLIDFDGGDWVVITPDGRFDTNKNLDRVEGLHWLFDDPLSPIPLEIFMRDYYEPRLLLRFLKADSLCKLEPLAELNRLQPKINGISVAPDNNNPDLVTVKVSVSSEAGQCWKKGRPERCESGVFDLRLYRDGQLVEQSPRPKGDLTTSSCPGAAREEQIQKWRKNGVVRTMTGQPITTTLDKQEEVFTGIRLPKRSGVSQVEFTAYAFNEDRVKSATSAPAVYPLPQPRPGVQRRAYVITVGVDVTSAGWRLRFARNGATEIEGVLQKSVGPQYQVVPIQLLSAYEKNSGELVNLATKRNIQTVLNILSGRNVDQADREKVPHHEQLQAATPDDLVVVYIASHGYVDPAGRFYVIPSDIGQPLGVSEELLDRCLKNSEKSSICEGGRNLLQRSISSDELTQWVEGIDAGQMVLILDSCHSGAVSGLGFKPGPMGDRSFGQLSYDKGMLVLAATQAEQLDTGTLVLGNRSLLTYALIQQQPLMQTLNLRQWLREAEQRVPKLYQQYVKPEATTSSISETDQEPLLFDFSKGNPKSN